MEQRKLEIRDEPAAAAAGSRREGGLAAVAKAMMEPPKDLRLQASVFFLACGGAMVLHGTTTGPTMDSAAANPEHVLVGYAMCTVGAALAFLTLSGAGSLRRAAARLEEALRGYFS